MKKKTGYEIWQGEGCSSEGDEDECLNRVESFSQDDLFSDFRDMIPTTNQYVSDNYNTVGLKETRNRDPKLALHNKEKYDHTHDENLTVEKISKNLRMQAIWVTYCSPEYKKFVESMQNPENKHLQICLTCW